MSEPYGQPGQWRPSESDRQAASERLRTAVDEGRLDLMEFDQRLRAVETAQTMAELDRIMADLPGPAEPLLVQIGELAITRSTVLTPAGPIPLRGSQWTVQDQWLASQKTPSWAIVVAILGFFVVCALSLLFLLVRETQYQGTVDVGISNGQQHFVTRIAVYSQQQLQHIYQQVNYVRSLTAL